MHMFLDVWAAQRERQVKQTSMEEAAGVLNGKAATHLTDCSSSGVRKQGSRGRRVAYRLRDRALGGSTSEQDKENESADHLTHEPAGRLTARKPTSASVTATRSESCRDPCALDRR